MKARLKPDRPYTILVRGKHDLQSRVDIGHEVRHRVGDVLKQVESGKRVLLVSQPSIPRQWRTDVASSLTDQGFKVDEHLLPDGEAAKDVSELQRLWSFLQELGFTRSDCIVAVGGGACTDISGFAAATYLRGIKLVLVPTTLLAQVDASIGGKTGINLEKGKNLAGSFYFPSSVLVDPDILQTLPERDFRSGMGEIIKYALIEATVKEKTDYKMGPRRLLDVIDENFKDGKPVSEDVLLPLISCCIRMKLAVVLADPYESGLRRCLNLGHTLGHAIEKVSAYSITHGEAVAIGSMFACSVAQRVGRLSEAHCRQFRESLQRLHLPDSIPDLPHDKLIASMAHDKKRQGAAIKFVLPEGSLGHVTIDFDMPVDRIAELLV